MKIGIILLIIAQLIKVFLAGMYFQDKFFWADGAIERIKVIFAVIGIIILGEIAGVFAIVIMIFGFIHHRMWDKLHLSFIIKYMVFKRPLLYDKLKYGILKQHADELHPAWYNFDDRIFKHCVYWALKKYKTA
jgi:hypothetical protein